jgi:creatinine amidohydrolase
MLLSDLSWIEFRDKAKQIKAAVIPVASIEQSGPYLPLGTDWFIAQELAKRISAKEDALVLPVIPFGYAPYHLDYPGTVSIDEPALRSYLMGICEGLIRWGIKRFVFINAHGGNRSILESISIDLRRRCSAYAAIIQWWDFCSAADPEWTTAGHGDAASISLIMATQPSLVKTGTYDLSQVPLTSRLKPAAWTKTEFGNGSVNLFLNTRDFTRDGGFGFGKTRDSSEASPEKGERIFEAATEFIRDLIDELANPALP